jgi:hypothetical protein
MDSEKAGTEQSGRLMEFTSDRLMTLRRHNLDTAQRFRRLAKIYADAAKHYDAHGVPIDKEETDA